MNDVLAFIDGAVVAVHHPCHLNVRYGCKHSIKPYSVSTEAYVKSRWSMVLLDLDVSFILRNNREDTRPYASSAVPHRLTIHARDFSMALPSDCADTDYFRDIFHLTCHVPSHHSPNPVARTMEVSDYQPTNAHCICSSDLYRHLPQDPAVKCSSATPTSDRLLSLMSSI